ncbi:hypothetical protein SLS62_002658 [Diatrype stigma]|uniref:Mediator of RNA polymerase II transcription subunit 9 n=1 Tax=Diatrype stigma TaxID=117547 RepID=A0AAN9UUA6_9PEZI
MTSANPRSNSTLAMPPGLNPSSLDTITEVAHLLSQLRTPQTTTTTTSSTAGPGTGASSNLPGATPSASATATATAPTPSQPPSQQHPPPHSQQTQTQTPGGGTGDPQKDVAEELTLKEIPAAADALKHRFQRARAQIATLPDLGRAIADQRAEMAALEARLAKQREVLARLRDVGVRFAAETSLGRDGRDRERDQDQEGDSRML